jgi:hypothetical protein
MRGAAQQLIEDSLNSIHAAMPEQLPSPSLQTRCRRRSERTSLLKCLRASTLNFMVHFAHLEKKKSLWAPTTMYRLAMSHTNEIMRLVTPHAVLLPSAE